MSTERFAERFGKAFDRRGLLRKIGAIGVGVTAAVFALPRRAEAADSGINCTQVKCCCVCIGVPVGTSCSGPIYCTWTWTCCSGGTRYRCIEGYGHQVACNPPSGQCNQYIECSGVLVAGSC